MSGVSRKLLHTELSSINMAPTAPYSPVEQPFLEHKDDFDSTDDLPLSFKHKVRRGKLGFLKAHGWVISTVFFFTTTMILLVGILTARLVYLPSPAGSFETGFATDLGERFSPCTRILALTTYLAEAAKPWMEAKRVRFTGMLKFHENGSMYRDYPKDQPLYVGPPTPEIDKAWNDLLYASAVDLPTELAGEMTKLTWEEPQGDLWRTG